VTAGVDACEWLRQGAAGRRQAVFIDAEVALKRFTCKHCGSDMDLNQDVVSADYRAGVKLVSEILLRYGWRRKR
jgi:hypothetical protein